MAQTTIAYLERRYTTLENEIADALHHRPTDDRAIDDLKYRKLIIADEIQHNLRLIEMAQHCTPERCDGRAPPSS